MLGLPRLFGGVQELAPDKIEAIQGLRAVAAIFVILFHWSFLFLGWSGVWVFFVISGFVITRSLISLDKADNLSSSKLGIFYRRRALRILPLYFAVVLAGIVILILEDPSGERLWGLRMTFVALATATVNFYRMTPGYEVNLIFDHFWSLSIEEHFYILMPLVFLYFSRRWLTFFLFACVVISPLVRVGIAAYFGTPGSGELVYQFSLSHFDAFSIGAFIALNEVRIRQRQLHAPWLLLAVFGSSLVWIILGAESWTPGGILQNFAASFSVNAEGAGRPLLTYAVMTYGSGAVILCVLEGRRWLVVPLSTRFMIYTGNLSYGLYLIHVPLQYLFNKVWGVTYLLPVGERLLPFALYIVTLYGLAHLSYFYFEKPIQRLGRPIARKGLRRNSLL